MAAITPTATTTDVAFGLHRDGQLVHLGRRYRRIPFVTNTVDDGDSFNTGLAAIGQVAWEADTSADQVAVRPNGNRVIFEAAASGNSGWVHLWAGDSSAADPVAGTVTPDDFTPEEVFQGVLSNGVKLEECQLREFNFTCSGTSPDTWTHDLEGVVAVAWAASDGMTDVAVTIITDSIIGFTYAAGTPEGVLYVWTRRR